MKQPKYSATQETTKEHLRKLGGNNWSRATGPKSAPSSNMQVQYGKHMKTAVKGRADVIEADLYQRYI